MGDDLADANVTKAHDMSIPAKIVSVKIGDSRNLTVNHDGTCYLILRRTFYNGWSYRVNHGAEHPVLKVNGGLQGIPLTGTGPSEVTLIYYPTGLRSAIGTSLGSTAAAICVVLLSLKRSPRLRPQPGTYQPADP